MRTILLRLPDHLLTLLESAAKTRGMTKSSIVRESLEFSLGPELKGGVKSCFDLARDLAGKVKGLPKDLAVNPKYMKNFGR